MCGDLITSEAEPAISLALRALCLNLALERTPHQIAQCCDAFRRNRPTHAAHEARDLARGAQ